MSYVQDSWLDSLVKHSIFDLNQQEKEAISYLKEGQTSQQPLENFILQHHNRIIALRQNDLFVAVGNQIRVLHLYELKDIWNEVSRNATENGQELDENWIHSVPYKVLYTPEINFNIEGLVPNTNGRLLAVVGQSRLVVVCLPRQGFSDVSFNRKKIDCRTLSVGTNYYDTSKNEILKVQWHSLSETRTHIVVLGTDNTLRMFNVSRDIEEPEQAFDLSPIEKTKKKAGYGGFSFDDDDSVDEDVVTFCLGGNSQDQSAWEPFTIFYSLRNGHMYSICPVIPFKSIICRNHLDTLSCLSKAKYEQAKESNKALSHLFTLHNEWISYLFESAKIVQNDLNSDTLFVKSSKEHMKYPVKRQGPFLINHTVSLTDGVQVTDILYINVDFVSVISLALNNGTVQNYIIGSEIDAQWQFPVHNMKYSWEKEVAILLTDYDFLPRASLYETINLNSGHSTPFHRNTFVHDPLYKDTFYVYHSEGVHSISTKKWIKKLAKLNMEVENGKCEETEILNWLKEKTKSEITLLVNSSPFQNGFVPVVGVVLISDMYLSYSLLALTNDYRLVTIDLNVRHNLVTSKGTKNAVKEQLKSVGNLNCDYQPLLPLPAYQVPKELENLPKPPKIVVPENMGGSKEIVINDDSLRFLSKASKQFRRETVKFEKAATDIDQRLMLQRKEYELQVLAFRNLYDRFQAVSSIEAKTAQEKKLKDLHQNHIKLRSRIDEQLRKLLKSYQPDLSNEEKVWVTKLKDISKQVAGDSGYVARIKQLKSQLDELNTKKNSLNTRSSNLNATQANNVLRSLKEQETLIAALEQRFKNLTTKVPLTA